MEETLDNLSFTTKPKEDLNGAGGVLAMGIISIPFCMGIIGLILAIVTLTKSKQLMNLYTEYPDSYTESSYKRVKAGRVCAIVSLSLLGFGILLLLLLSSSM